MSLLDFVLSPKLRAGRLEDNQIPDRPQVDTSDTVDAAVRRTVLQRLSNATSPGSPPLPHPVLVVIHASWCGHCTQLLMSPAVAAMRSRRLPMICLEEGDNGAEQILLAQNVRSFPTLLVVVPGEGEGQGPDGGDRPFAEPSEGVILPFPDSADAVTHIVNRSDTQTNPHVAALVKYLEANVRVSRNAVADVVAAIMAAHHDLQTDQVRGAADAAEGVSAAPAETAALQAMARYKRPEARLQTPTLVIVHATWCGHCVRLLGSAQIKELVHEGLAVLIDEARAEKCALVRRALDVQRVTRFPSLFVVVPIPSRSRDLVVPFPDTPDSAARARKLISMFVKKSGGSDSNLGLPALAVLAEVMQTAKRTRPSRDDVLPILRRLVAAMAAQRASQPRRSPSQQRGPATPRGAPSPEHWVDKEVYFEYKPNDRTVAQLCAVAETQRRLAARGKELRRGVVTRVWTGSGPGDEVYEIRPVTEPTGTFMSDCHGVYSPNA